MRADLAAPVGDAEVERGGPYRIEGLRQREVQAIGAAISTRDWHRLEQAYNSLRDKLDANLAALNGSSEDTQAPDVEMVERVARAIAECDRPADYSQVMWMKVRGDDIRTKARAAILAVRNSRNGLGG